MSRGVGSSWSSLLTAIALASVPAVAVFGVPNVDLTAVTRAIQDSGLFQPKSASAATLTTDDLFGASSVSAADLLADANLPPGEAAPRFVSASFESQPTPNAPGQVPGLPMAGPWHSDSAPEIVPAANESATSWKSAIEKLRLCGIERFRLEPGSSPESFLFVCFLESDTNPGVTYRFEAEGEQPLTAVAEVMSQVQQHSGTMVRR